MKNYNGNAREYQSWYHNPPSEHLYQTNPWPEEHPDGNQRNSTATSSLESYGLWARKESYCLYHNGRRAKFTLQLNLQREYHVADVPFLKKELKKLFDYLRRKKKIVAYAVIEVTRNERKTGPTDLPSRRLVLPHRRDYPFG